MNILAFFTPPSIYNLGYHFSSLNEYSSTPLVWTMISMLLHALINSEDISSAPYQYTQLNATLLSWFPNLVTSNLTISRCVCLILYLNPKGYEVSEHTSTKFKANLRMLSTLKKTKNNWSMKLGKFLRHQWLDLW